EEGALELRTVAAAFNRMAADLEGMERERAMVLAGISHDLRTPLSRLRLALEMSGADSAAAEGMSADIEEIDKVIGQVLDYARARARKPHGPPARHPAPRPGGAPVAQARDRQSRRQRAASRRRAGGDRDP